MRNVNGKRVAVLGLGESGREAAQLLQAHGAVVTLRDSAYGKASVERSAHDMQALGLRVQLGPDIRPEEKFDFVVLSPGIPPQADWVKVSTGGAAPLYGELEVASWFCICPLVAITGTNGKTTTTELIERIFCAAGKKTVASGNIGKALSSVMASDETWDVAVVEVSSFQLEAIDTFRPKISVHLNLTPDHLDRYLSMAEYQQAKWQIFRNQTADDFAIVNANLVLPEMKAQKITINANGLPADYEVSKGWLTVRGEKVLEQKETHLLGSHNAENMLAALAVADAMGLPRETTLAAMRSYQPLPHRCEKIAENNGVSYINDSKATNIDALEKALQAMTAPVVLIAGGKDKGLDFSDLVPLLREKVQGIILLGQMRDKLYQIWNATAPCFRVDSLGEAVDRAQQVAKPGHVVLFSPGCSSFDMFKSFEDRGDQFRELVLKKFPTQTQATQRPKIT